MAVLGSFLPLSQTSRNWFGMTVLGADVYCSVNGGNIYKQSGGSGNFITLSQTSRAWRAMASNGVDVYCSANTNTDIYKQTGGVGNFLPLGQGSFDWRAMTNNGLDVYAARYGNSIYKQTGGVGNFVSLGTTSRNWIGMTSCNGDVYACVQNGDIYKQTGGVGDFLPLSQTSRQWRGMTSLGDDVYAAVNFGDIYKQTGGVGDFVGIGETSRDWNYMTTLGGSVYCCLGFGDIYMAVNIQPSVTSIDPSTFISNGALLRIYGTNLEGGSTTEITIDGVDYTANIVSVSATEITFTAPRISSGLHYLVVIADSIESDSYSISYADQIYSAREYPCVSGSASWTLLMWYQCNQTAWGTVARIGDLDIFIGSPASNGTIGLGNNSVNIKASGVFLDNNSWHLIAIVNDNGTCKIGVDNGALSSTFTAPSGHSSMASKYSLKIGGNKTFNTYDVRLYNKALTAEQIDYYYDETLKTNPSFWEY